MRNLRVVPLVLAALLLAAVPAGAQKVIIGEHVEEVFETPARYPAEPGPALPDGVGTPAERSPRLVWSDTIRFPGATYIAPHFERMHLPPGDFVVVRSPDGEQSYRYTRFGKRDLGKTKDGFFAAHVKGDTAIVELYARRGPNANARGYGYRIDRYGRGYNDVEIQELWDAGLGEKMNLRPPRTSGEAPGAADWGVLYEKSICGGDDTDEAKCYQSSDPSAYEEARSVARLMLNGNAHCTGWLVGCEGHVMTNQHCIGSQSQANDIDFEFMAEGATCATDCRSALGCAGTIEASGGTLIAVDSGLDYALVLPDTTIGGGTDLNTAYGYMQLRDTGPTLGERLYVPQHPAGWGKRIAMESTHALDSGFVQVNSVTEPACQSGGPTNGETGYFGDTRGGSSGSPVLGYSDDRVVALHHCRGGFACTGTGGDPNRGVPIDLVIADLGSSLPACAIDSCSPQPIANAGADRSICLGSSTTLGTSAQSGHSYSWSPGGATTAQVLVSPTATTTYTLTATTSCGSAQDSVVVTVDDGSGGGLSADFESGTSGWTATGLWHATASSSCASPGYSSPVTAFYYGQDGTCDYDTGSGTSGTLTSPPITGITASSTLSFDYYREVESYSGSYDRTEVEVVTSSGATTVFSLDSSDASSASWTSSGAIPLGSFAGQTIQVRFRFDSVDSVSNGFTGWLVDDVVVTGDSTCGGGGGPAAIDWSSTALTAYSNQDASGTVTVEDGGATLAMEGNRWRRTTGTYTLTADTVLAFDFRRTDEGEIHGIGFDENDTLTDAVRIFQLDGTQSWIDGDHTYDGGYSSPGTWQSYQIPVGSFYTGSGFRLVLVNDKDSGSLVNDSRFRNVRVYDVP